MKLDQIKRLVQYYIDSSLEEAKSFRLTNIPDEEEGEGIDYALYSALRDAQKQLQLKDYKKIAKEADELLQSHKVTILKTSGAYRRLCRDLLKAKQVVLKAALDRIDGRYWGIDSPA